MPDASTSRNRELKWDGWLLYVEAYKALFNGNHPGTDSVSPAALQEMVERLRCAGSETASTGLLARLIDLIKAMDMQATRITRVEGDEEVVDGYRFNTGCWHRILGLIAGHEAAAWLRTPEGQARVKEAAERAASTIEELEKARAIDWDKFRNWRATL